MLILRVFPKRLGRVKRVPSLQFNKSCSISLVLSSNCSFHCHNKNYISGAFCPEFILPNNKNLMVPAPTVSTKTSSCTCFNANSNKTSNTQLNGIAIQETNPISEIVTYHYIIGSSQLSFLITFNFALLLVTLFPFTSVTTHLQL